MIYQYSLGKLYNKRSYHEFLRKQVLLEVVMKCTVTAFDKVLIIDPVIYQDERGCFYESWNQKVFEKAGIRCIWVQDNLSKSNCGVVRGIHYQRPPYSQTKLVHVIQGTILDVIVDLRAGSPTYGRHLAIELSADRPRQIFIPKGFGHGFSVLSETAHVIYKCDALYVPSAEVSINAYDLQLDIDWRIDKRNVLLSDKDKKGQSFAEYARAPDFAYCDFKNNF